MYPALLMLVACSGSPVPLDGAWIIEGEGALGLVEAHPAGGCSDGGVQVALHGPALSTGGPVPAEASEEEPGVVWLYFPVQTALGSGQAALRLQGNEAMVPMGARPGELELRLARSAGRPSDEALQAAALASQRQVEAARQAWAEGIFRIVDDRERLVGEVRIPADAAPLVAVYDRTWWTGGLVQADRVDEGPDLVLTFPVEPAMRGEEGQLRLNAPLSLAVVPADRVPTDLDRVLRLVPGVVEPEEREAAMAAAREEADQAEAAAMVDLGRLLAVRARTDDGRCRSWQELNPDLADVLVGYDLRIVEEGGRCVVEVEPTLSQHRRRLRARIGPDGRLPGP